MHPVEADAVDVVQTAQFTLVDGRDAGGRLCLIGGQGFHTPEPRERVGAGVYTTFTPRVTLRYVNNHHHHHYHYQYRY